jgi:hypothetical protein
VEDPIRLHLRPMHPGDRLGPTPDGVSGAACDASVPAEWIRIPAPKVAAIHDLLAEWRGDPGGLLAGGP